MSRRWVSSAIVALAAVATLAGCSFQKLDTASLVGDYVSASTKGEIVLAGDGTFTASSVPLAVLDDGATAATRRRSCAPGSCGTTSTATGVDLSGTWKVENMKSDTSFV